MAEDIFYLFELIFYFAICAGLVFAIIFGVRYAFKCKALWKSIIVILIVSPVTGFFIGSFITMGIMAYSYKAPMDAPGFGGVIIITWIAISLIMSFLFLLFTGIFLILHHRRRKSLE